MDGLLELKIDVPNLVSCHFTQVTYLGVFSLLQTEVTDGIFHVTTIYYKDFKTVEVFMKLVDLRNLPATVVSSRFGESVVGMREERIHRITVTFTVLFSSMERDNLSI